MDIIEILAAGKKRVLDVINTGKSLMKEINEQTVVCPEFSKSIVFKKILGRGSYGIAILVEIDGKEYVAKKMKVYVPVIILEHDGKPDSVIKILKQYSDKYEIPLNALKFYNQHWEYQFTKYCAKKTTEILEKEGLEEYTKSLDISSPEMVFPSSETVKNKYKHDIIKELKERKLFMKGDINDKVTLINVVIPFSSDCLHKKHFVYWDLREKLCTINPPSYLCPKESYSEYAISLYGDILRRKGFYNFMKVLGFTAWPEKRKEQPEQIMMESSHYIFMEQIDGTVQLLYKKLSTTDKNSIVFQLVFSIATYQHYFKICHNDLHPNNIFLKEITEEHELYDSEYFHASVLGKDFYWPRGKYLVKIGDFGLSVKWKEPVVGNKILIEGTYNDKPNWYSPAYDLVYSLYRLINHSFMKISLASSILKYAMTRLGDDKKIDEHISNIFGTVIISPRLDLLSKLDMDAVKVFKHCDVLEKYTLFPCDKKVKTIGNIK